MKIITIGVYGYEEAAFFDALQQAGVDTFCDIRARRGVRGSQYAFANSQRLQKRLAEMGIRYVHFKQLAPSDAVRARQNQADKHQHVGKRARTELSKDFVEAYERECLSHFNADDFLSAVGPDAQIVALFCVERQPTACHRSLAATKLAHDLRVPVEHIVL